MLNVDEQRLTKIVKDALAEIFQMSEFESLTPAETAALMKVHLEQLAKMRRRGDGPPWYRWGKRTIRYKRHEVIAYLDALPRGDVQ